MQMAKKKPKGNRDREAKPKPDEDFDRDLREIGQIAAEIADTFSKRMFSPQEVKTDTSAASPIEFFVKLAGTVGENYAVSIVEIAALSYCMRAVAEQYSSIGGEDILAFQRSKRALVQVLNDSSRTIRRLRGGEAKSFRDIIRIFDDSFSRARKPGKGAVADGLQALLLSNIDTMKSDPAKVDETVQELIDMLVRFQLVIGIILKWSFVAEEKFISQVKEGAKDVDWSKLYKEYLQPLLVQLGVLGRSLELKPTSGKRGI